MNQIRVLLVDDHEIVRFGLRTAFEAEPDIRVAGEAGDGAEAVRMAVALRPSVVVLDIRMGAMDGIEACRQIKASPKTHDIPVIFLTSLESATDEEHGLSLGASDFIHKPFSPPVVLARVKNHLMLASALRDLRRHNEMLESVVAARTREVVRQAEQLARRNRVVS